MNYEHRWRLTPLAHALGISYRQADFWYVKAAHRGGRTLGSGNARLLDRSEVTELVAMRDLMRVFRHTDRAGYLAAMATYGDPSDVDDEAGIEYTDDGMVQTHIGTVTVTLDIHAVRDAADELMARLIPESVFIGGDAA